MILPPAAARLIMADICDYADAVLENTGAVTTGASFFFDPRLPAWGASFHTISGRPPFAFNSIRFTLTTRVGEVQLYGRHYIVSAAADRLRTLVGALAQGVRYTETDGSVSIPVSLQSLLYYARHWACNEELISALSLAYESAEPQADAAPLPYLLHAEETPAAATAAAAAAPDDPLDFAADTFRNIL